MSEQLKQNLKVPPEYFEAFLKTYNWSWHQTARGELPRPFKTLDELQLACICADPVLWCQTFLKNPDEPESPWVFWDYQIESIRYQGNTVHECGAEVGKTREIIAFILWKAFTTRLGSGLVIAPMAIHYIEILDAIINQLSENENLAKSLILHRKHPHHHLKFSNGFTIDFRPAGFDGEALRGVHAKTFVIVEEAAKIKNRKVYSETWRAGKPGCVFKMYSVPDGDRSTVYFKTCRQADNISGDNKDKSIASGLEFKHFRWAKDIMPPPFWTPARREFYIQQYGGEDAPGYRQNILGQPGDPENSVFPWNKFELILRDIPEYRCLKIMLDESAGEVILRGTRIISDNSNPQEKIILDTRINKTAFNIEQEIIRFFQGISGGLFFGGGDLGFSNDPTEILIKQVIGKTHRIVARLQLKGVTYDQQAEAIAAIDKVYDGNNKMGWGIDFGNAGSAVVHILHGQKLYEDCQFTDRLVGYQFGAAYDAVDEDGEVIIDRRTEKPVRLSAKELATDIMVSKMQRLELQYPYDPDIILYYPNHTFRQGEKNRIYKKIDDHIIDADRVSLLRILLHGEGAEDLFACGN